MLIGNYSLLHKTVTRYVGGLSLSGDPSNWNKPGMLRSRAVGLEGKQVAIPLGFTDTGAWFYPRTVGGMVIRADGVGNLSSNLIPTLTMQIDFTGVGDLDALAALAVAMNLAMSGSGNFAATIEGRLNASVNMSGSGSMTSSLQGVASMLVNLLGAGDLDSTVAAYGNMDVDIVVTGAGLTSGNIAKAVWDAIAVENNSTGTMGKKLNDAEKSAKLSAALSA